MDVTRPRGISDQSWQAISHHRERLDRAWSVPVDESAAIGAAKELCESVARVVLVERAVPYSLSDDMPKLVRAAHGTLDRLPGRGQVAQAAVRNLSQAALSIVTILVELRNELGTGHGRAKVPRVSREAAVAASDAAVLWTRWALTRLDELLGGDVDLLIAELSGAGWSRGKLDRRFDEVGLDSLFADDQRRLGVAVTNRTMGGTFVVRESGVDPLLDRPLEWPEAYRLGVAAGLLLSPSGHVALRSRFVPVLASIVAQMGTEDWRQMSGEVMESPLNPSWATDLTELTEIRSALEAATPALPERALPGWQGLAMRLADPVDEPK